ncbi:MAG: DUF2971 domain-containing protein [Pseudomonadota bacterium]
MLETVLEALGPGLSEIARVSARKAAHFASNLIPKRSSSVCCFSETRNHQAMWAYYANNFAGLCIEYDVDRLISLLDLAFGNRFYEVSYAAGRTLTSEHYLGSNEETAGHQSFCTKHIDWKHEREWRLVQQGKSGASFHTANAISAVAIGPRATADHTHAIMETARTRAFDVQSMTFDRHLLVARQIEIERQQKPAVECEMSERAEEGRREAIANGVDEESLVRAIEKLRKYPDADKLHYLSLDPDGGSELYAQLWFNLPDGSEKMKLLRFDVTNGVVSEGFEYR